MWLGQVARMDMNRKAKQVMNWTSGRKRGRGRPRKNWPETIRKDLRGLELTWEDALDAADRDGRRKRIARCAVQGLRHVHKVYNRHNIWKLETTYSMH